MSRTHWYTKSCLFWVILSRGNIWLSPHLFPLLSWREGWVSGINSNDYWSMCQVSKVKCFWSKIRSISFRVQPFGTNSLLNPTNRIYSVLSLTSSPTQKVRKVFSVNQFAQKCTTIANEHIWPVIFPPLQVPPGWWFSRLNPHWSSQHVIHDLTSICAVSEIELAQYCNRLTKTRRCHSCSTLFMSGRKDFNQNIIIVTVTKIKTSSTRQ